MVTYKHVPLNCKYLSQSSGRKELAVQIPLQLRWAFKMVTSNGLHVSLSQQLQNRPVMAVSEWDQHASMADGMMSGQFSCNFQISCTMPMLSMLTMLLSSSAELLRLRVARLTWKRFKRSV